MIVTDLIFLIVWLATVRYALTERNGRLAAEAYIFAVSAATANHAAGMALQSAQVAEHLSLKEKMAPFIAAHKDADATDDQKHYRILLDFLKEHPGTSVESAQVALASLTKQDGPRQ